MLHLAKLTDIPPDFGETVVTIGNFDGVHRGHATLLAEVVRRARARGARSCAVTFDPHPLQVLHPQRAPQQLCPNAIRLERLERTGLDAVLVLDFTRQLAAMTAERFVQEVFVEALDVVEVVVGRDTRFGARNAGDVDTLRALGAEHGFEVTVLPDIGDGQRLSSTQARGALREGRVDAAADVLGRPHQVRGVVVRGLQRGRELGFPTANLGRPEGMIPSDGVYVGWLVRDALPGDHAEHRMPAAISVGTNPTFDDVPERTVEAYVLDRDDLDLYDEMVRIEFVQRLRGNTRFESVDQLIEQMKRDVVRARSICAEGAPID